MPALIIKPKTVNLKNTLGLGNESDIQLNIPINKIYTSYPSLGIDFDFFGEWEDGIWGEVDAIYDYGEIRPS